MNESEVDQRQTAVEEMQYPSGEELSRLRRLLLGPEQEQIRKLQQRLDDPALHADEIGKHLPKAIVLRSHKDDQLKTALLPTVEGIVKTSVRKDLKVFADALFPVIGPAIRKSIAETFKGMIQSINKTLEQSVSWQGVKWRIEALRTGKPFGEIVLSHTLLYRVEQVFLIHKETGLMLQHVVADSPVFQDADMVSSMLKAIQDFVQDSFSTQKGDALDTLTVGDLNVWIQQSPHAILAGVIRGIAPESLRSAFQETLENIQLEKSEALESFTGDTAPFESTDDQLKECLQAQYKAKKRKVSIRTWIFLGIVVLLLGAWIFITIRNQIRWNHYIQTLRDTPGIVITDVDKRAGDYYFAGLLDPLAPDPTALLEQSKLDADDASFHWEPYYSMHPELMKQRIHRILNPPESASVQFDGKTLRATGTAPDAWIKKTREQVRLLPWSLQFNDEGLINSERSEIEQIRSRINQRFLLYETNSSRVPIDQTEALSDISSDVSSLFAITQQLGIRTQIQIRGHADNFGSKQANLRLSQRRADNILAFFTTQGLNPDAFIAVGLGEEEPEDAAIKSRTGGINRCVTFNVIMDETEQ